jgi:hypothetical protein
MMAVFVILFDLVPFVDTPHALRACRRIADVIAFVHQPLALPLLATLLGIAIAGGMFVVPLYAFLTTVVDKAETSRTIAANNIVNAGAMVIGCSSPWA